VAARLRVLYEKARHPSLGFALHIAVFVAV
jgi:hypothetical protein